MTWVADSTTIMCLFVITCIITLVINAHSMANFNDLVLSQLLVVIVINILKLLYKVISENFNEDFNKDGMEIGYKNQRIYIA